MTNYDMDEIERNKSQKQKKQWRNYVTDSLKHPLDSSEATKMPMSAPVVLDDQENIKNILKSSKPIQQWDAETQSYVNVELPLVDDNTSREELDMLRRPFEKEEVTNPKHYNERKMEPLDYIIANEPVSYTHLTLPTIYSV